MSARELEMRRGVCVPSEPVLGLCQHGERFPAGVVVQPWRTEKQSARVLEAASLDFGLRAFDDEECIRIGLALGRGEQRLGSMPGSARETQRVRRANDALRLHRRRCDPLPRERRNAEGGAQRHDPDRLTRASTR